MMLFKNGDHPFQGWRLWNAQQNEDIYDSIFVEEKSKEYVEYELYRIISIIDISNE